MHEQPKEPPRTLDQKVQALGEMVDAQAQELKRLRQMLDEQSILIAEQARTIRREPKEKG